jgi:hypothetical protein
MWRPFLVALPGRDVGQQQRILDANDTAPQMLVRG